MVKLRFNLAINVKRFIHVRFGEEVQLWKPSLVKITGEVLQEAWK
jgi:hypothetical protein